MKISLVYAATMTGVIGDNNSLPKWKLKNDMERFKAVTMGHHVVMGRKTYESIPDRFRPLPGRKNLVITRNPDKYSEAFGDQVKLFKSIEYAIDHARRVGEENLMIIGGGQVYNHFLEDNLNRVDTIYETLVHDDKLTGDTALDLSVIAESGLFKLGVDDRFPIDDNHTHEYSFRRWDKK